MTTTRYWAVPLGSDWFQIRSGPKRPSLLQSTLSLSSRKITFRSYTGGRRIGTIRRSVLSAYCAVNEDRKTTPGAENIWQISPEFVSYARKRGKIV